MVTASQLRKTVMIPFGATAETVTCNLKVFLSTSINTLSTTRFCLFISWTCKLRFWEKNLHPLHLFSEHNLAPKPR